MGNFLLYIVHLLVVDHLYYKVHELGYYFLNEISLFLIVIIYFIL